MFPWILHIDGDGFFAYCEIARFPHLRGKPVVVGEDRGIVCAMTYEAKKLGITRAMPIFKIREQFPTVTILSSHFELYEQYARKLATLLEKSIDVVERYSIDECFARILLPSAWNKEELYNWLSSIKKKIQQDIGLTYSFGLARTKVLAKIASKREKPDGCTILLPEDETRVLQETAIGSLWGIGWGLSKRLKERGIQTAYQLSTVPEAIIAKSFAVPVQELWHELQGRKMFNVSNTDSLPKSLQSTKSFIPASSDLAFVMAELLQNIDIVFARMRRYMLTTNCISIFLKTTERRYYSYNFVLPYYTDNPLMVSGTICEQAKKMFQKGIRYKATGTSVWGLRTQSMVPSDLFSIQENIHDAGKIMQSVDEIRKRYGYFSITMLGSLPSTRDRIKKISIRRMNEKFIHGLPLPYLGEVS